MHVIISVNTVKQSPFIHYRSRWCQLLTFDHDMFLQAIQNEWTFKSQCCCKATLAENEQCSCYVVKLYNCQRQSWPSLSVVWFSLHRSEGVTSAAAIISALRPMKRLNECLIDTQDCLFSIHTLPHLLTQGYGSSPILMACALVWVFHLLTVCTAWLKWI